MNSPGPVSLLFPARTKKKHPTVPAFRKRSTKPSSETPKARIVRFPSRSKRVLKSCNSTTGAVGQKRKLAPMNLPFKNEWVLISMQMNAACPKRKRKYGRSLRTRIRPFRLLDQPPVLLHGKPPRLLPNWNLRLFKHRSKIRKDHGGDTDSGEHRPRARGRRRHDRQAKERWTTTPFQPSKVSWKNTTDTRTGKLSWKVRAKTRQSPIQRSHGTCS